MSLEIQFLPARQGDAIWIRWGPAEDRKQIMIDMGTEEIGHQVRKRISDLDATDRTFELLIVTHVDRDHIGGVLTAVSDADAPLAGLKFADVWFNGWDHLHGRTAPTATAAAKVEPMGPVQGERLAKWLRATSWNERFGRGPVERAPDVLPVLEFPHGLTLTLLGPTRDRLTDFIDTWKEEVAAALAKGSIDDEDVSDGLRPPAHTKLESFGAKTPPDLLDTVDLEELADAPTGKDPSKANGSSISVLMQWNHVKVLLCGDAYAEDLVAAFNLLGGGKPFQLDVVKLPHHGSANNVTDEMVRSMSCPYWVFSTDGTTFRHPDAVAIARILRAHAGSNPTLGFNVPSRFNGWWDRDDWRALFGYSTEYGTVEEGLTLNFPD